MADVKMPQLGEAVTEGTIIRWLKSEGDFVTQDEPLFEVSTDKVDSEVPSPASGIIEKIIFPEGETVDVGTTLAVIGQQDSATATTPEPPLPASNLSSLAGLRDLAAITASLGVAAHMDQVSLVPEPIKNQEPVTDIKPALEHMGQPETPVSPDSETPVSPQDSLDDFYPPSSEDSYLPLVTQQYETDQEDAFSGTEPYPLLHPDVYSTDIDHLGKEESSSVEPSPSDFTAVETPAQNKEILVVSPLVRHLAEENKLNLSLIRGTGPGGVITREDVLAQLGAQKQDETIAKADDHQPAIVDEPIATESILVPEKDDYKPAIADEPIATETTFSPEASGYPPGDMIQTSVEESATSPDLQDFLTAEEIAAERLNVQPVETNVAMGQDQIVLSQSAETANILGKLWNNTSEIMSESPTETQRYRKGAESLKRTADLPGKRDERIPFTAMRRMTAEHMLRSKTVSPHSFVVREVDFEQVEQARQTINQPENTLFDFHVTYLPFVLHALAKALPKYKKINSSVGRDELIVHNRINIGIVVDLNGDGMIVPVLHDADEYKLPDLVIETRKLITKGRSRSLGAEDLTGATISVSNQGAIGAALTFPVITQPQVAILSIEEIKRKPVVISSQGEEAIAIHPVGMLGMAFDARVIDASYAAAFLRDMSYVIENDDFSSQLGLGS